MGPRYEAWAYCKSRKNIWTMLTAVNSQFSSVLVTLLNQYFLHPSGALGHEQIAQMFLSFYTQAIFSI